MDKYILDTKNNPIPTSFDEWVKWETENQDRRIISRNRIFINEEEILISTVFLGIDHSFNRLHPPIVFETMIFGGKQDGWQDRYHTYREACDGHLKALEMVRKENDNQEIQSHS